jgi:hypothetical protein
VRAKATIPGARAAFTIWVAKHPLDGDRPFGPFSARYQVGRYCDYLGANPWAAGNPLQDVAARDGAVDAYRLYLGMFAPASTIEIVMTNLDHFYIFLGLGPVVREAEAVGARGAAG